MGSKSVTRLVTTLYDILVQSLSAVSSVIEDPRADLTQTALVIGVIAIVVLVLVLLTLAAYFAISDRIRPRRRIVIPAREPARRETAVGWIVFLLLMVVLYLSVANYAAKPVTCALCHGSRQAESLNRSPHRGVSCMACHKRPGAAGSLVTGVDYLRWIARFSGGEEKKHKADVASQSCLHCHRYIEQRVVSSRGIRVLHVDLAEGGYKCVDCHNTVAHGEDVASPKEPSMTKCVFCHNGEVASADCEICHVAASKQASTELGQRVFDREYIRTSLPPPADCRGGCHNIEAECTVCHGLEMPHSANFRKVKHGRLGFLDKELCWRCHGTPYQFCNRCHRFPSIHSPPERWKTTHIVAAQNPEGGFRDPESDEFIKGCGGCHSRRRLCEACHDDGKQAAK